MSRTEQPLDRDGSPVRELAQRLRDLRRASGLTYQQLAARTHYSTSTLQEAASGRRLPTLPVLLAVVSSCNGDPVAWQGYWEQIKRLVDSGTETPSPDDVTPSWERTQPPTEAQPRSVTKRRPWPIRYRWATAGIVAIVAAITAVAALLSRAPADPSEAFPPAASHPAAPAARQSNKTYTEQEYNHNGAPTFAYLDGSGAGDPIGFGQFVQVSCKVYDVTLPSTRPDGYWYRIASLPWSNHYYAVANTFGNGDPLSGPYSHNTDWRVPNC